MRLKDTVTERFFADVGPRLEKDGFRRAVRRWSYRDNPTEANPLTTDVIEIHFFDASTQRTWGTTLHSFGVSCGVHLSYCPNPFGGAISKSAAGNLQPDVTVCAIRTYARRRLRQPKHVPSNVWQVDADLGNMDAVLQDVWQSIESDVLPWFSRFRELEGILHLLQTAEEKMDGSPPCFGFGRMDSPVRNLYLGFTALQCGQAELARSALERSVAKGGFKNVSGSTQLDERIESELSRLRG